MFENSHIKVIDKIDSNDNDICLYSYINCKNTDDDFIKKTRGIITLNNKILSNIFQYTDKYSHNDDSLTDVLKDMNKWNFYKSYEGTYIRLIYMLDEWYVTTPKKLNAFRSKWNSDMSHGELFKKSISKYVDYEKFLLTLNTKYQYVFLLLPCKDNSIICRNSTDMVYHISTYDGNVRKNVNTHNIPYIQELKFETYDDLIRYVSNIDIFTYQGVTAIHKKTYKRIKIFNDIYLKYYEVRGKEPSLNFRYIQVRLNKEYTDILYKIYPEHICDFEKIEEYILNISKKLHLKYIQKYIKKININLTYIERNILNTCHEWHIKNRLNNKIDLIRVIDIVNKQKPSIINELIKKNNIKECEKIIPRHVLFNSPVLDNIKNSMTLPELNLNK